MLEKYIQQNPVIASPLNMIFMALTKATYKEWKFPTVVFAVISQLLTACLMSGVYSTLFLIKCSRQGVSLLFTFVVLMQFISVWRTFQ
jgi:hypothetical protein